MDMCGMMLIGQQSSEEPCDETSFGKKNSSQLGTKKINIRRKHNEPLPKRHRQMERLTVARKNFGLDILLAGRL